MNLGEFDYERCARIFLAGTFLLAAVLKLARGGGDDQRLLIAIGVRNRRYVTAVVRLLPLFEIGLTLWLLSGWAPMSSLAFVTCVLAIFFSIVMRAWRQDYDGGCGCFGSVSAGRISIGDVIGHAMLVTIGFSALAFRWETGQSAWTSVWSVTVWDAVGITLLALTLASVNALLGEVESVIRRLPLLEDIDV